MPASIPSPILRDASRAASDPAASTQEQAIKRIPSSGTIGLVLVLSAFVALLALSLVALARIDETYRAAQLMIDRSLRSVLRAVPSGRDVEPGLTGLLDAVGNLERIAVRVDLGEPSAAMARLRDEYRSGLAGDEEFVDRFCGLYDRLEASLAEKRSSIAGSFYALIAALAAGLLVAVAVGAGLGLRLRVSMVEAEWSRKSLLAALSAEERLRKRIANDLHDDAAQDVAAARMLCERAAAGPSAPGPSAPDSSSTVAGLAAEAAGLLSSAGRKLRGIALDLRPPELERSGLVAALEALCSKGRGLSVRPVSFSASRDAAAAARSLGEEAAIQVYRIVQEALANARKHAPGNAVEVAMRVEKDSGASGLMIRIVDRPDAATVTPASPLPHDGSASSGMGMSTIRERATIAGGELTAAAAEGGYRVTLFLPFRAEGGTP